MIDYGPEPAFGSEVISYPVASVGVTATAGAANTYGAAAEIAAAGLITSDCVLVEVGVSTPSGALVGKVEVGYNDGVATYVYETPAFEFAASDLTTKTFRCYGLGGIVPSGASLIARHKSVAGGTTVNIHVSRMNVP